MKKEILLYSSIYSGTAALFINEMEANRDKDIVVRMNTPGGEVFANYGMIAKFKEHTKGKHLKIDGWAASGGAYFCCYADDAECLDVSQFLFHRAAYPPYIENNSELFNDEMKASLTAMNVPLRAAMEGKFTAEKWLQVTGVSLDELFSLDTRIDVTLSADQAKQLGLVSKINKLTPEKKSEIDAMAMHIAAFGSVEALKTATTETTINTKIKKMTIEQLKAEQPDVYAAVIKLGVAQERDRVGSYMVFNDVDPVAVAKGIASGDPISQTAQAEFNRKASAAQFRQQVVAENAEVITPEEATTAAGKEEKELEAFDADWRAKLPAFRG